MARSAPDLRCAPWGVLVALAFGLWACRAGESERCVCAEDCKSGLVCVAGGRVLADGQCTPAVGEDANPGTCVPADEAAEGDGADGYPEVFMDMGSKRDFDPGPPPDPETEGVTGTTDATGTGTTTEATAGSSTGGTTDATTDATGTSSTGTTDATGTGSTGGR